MNENLCDECVTDEDVTDEYVTDEYVNNEYATNEYATDNSRSAKRPSIHQRKVKQSSRCCRATAVNLHPWSETMKLLL